MRQATVLLVNPNQMKPPIAPLGLEYTADRLALHGYHPIPCDLCFAESPDRVLADAVAVHQPDAVAVSVRNIDDAYFASQDFVLERTARVVSGLRQHTRAPIVLGGVGFSIAPREVLAYTSADFGLTGDSAEHLGHLLDPILADQTPVDVPGAVFQDGECIRHTPAKPADLDSWPTPRRRWFDNSRYFAEGGQAGIETKRGCPANCFYCVESRPHGPGQRLRPPASVVQEFKDLLEQGIDVVHLCDSEFNLPRRHALAVCHALAEAGLGSRVRWYAYAAPVPFDLELARAMARAGCAGLNFGVDHADPGILRRLGRNHTADDIASAVSACRSAGLAVMLDLLLGGPGESRDTLARAVDTVRAIAPDCAGLACGVRVYPYTHLARDVLAAGALAHNPNLRGALEDNPALLRPVYYVEAGIGGDIHDAVSELVRGDSMFFHANPNELDGNYNYNDNSVLANAIRNGARGAYWDILRNASRW